MSSPEIPEHDLVDKLLGVEGPTRGDRIRPLLLAQTTSVVRRWRLVRRLGVIAALAVCYLAGIATVQAWKSSPVQWGPSVVEQRAPSGEKLHERIGPTPRPPESPGTRHERPVRRPDRRDAVVAQADFEQIRRVSDRFLYEEGDIATALHYYTRALDRAAPEQLAISVEKDSWLLMALKQARQEENENDDRGA